MALEPTGSQFGGDCGGGSSDPGVVVVDFKPSDVNLCDSFPPLVGTMGRTEAEFCGPATM